MIEAWGRRRLPIVVVPLLAVALAAAAQHLLRGGVEVGLLRLAAVAFALPVLAEAGRRLRGASSPVDLVPPLMATAGGLLALVVYPLNSKVAILTLCVALASVVRGLVWRIARRDTARPGAPPWTCLAALLAAFVVFRSVIEPGPVPYNPRIDDLPLSAALRFFLPIEFEGARKMWSATGFMPLVVLQALISNKAAYVLIHGLATVTTFLTTWAARRSQTFTLATTACIAFGTQFHYVYSTSGCMIFILLVIYAQTNLLALHQMLRTGRPAWRALFVASLVACALCYDTWVDYAAFLVLATLYLALIARRRGLAGWTRELRFAGAATAAVLGLFLLVRVGLMNDGQFTKPGHEHEIVSLRGGVPMMVLALEDVLSNYVTYLYIACSNYLPPPFVMSNALLLLGGEPIAAAQNGYEAHHAQVVIDHHQFLWYIHAGVVLCLFVRWWGGVLIRSLRGQGMKSVQLSVVGLLIATGSLTHCLIKFRPFMSMPTLSYKCVLSVFGVSLLIGYALQAARERCAPSTWRVVVALFCGLLAAGAIARPRMIVEAGQAFVGREPLPDPLAFLAGHQ